MFPMFTRILPAKEYCFPLMISLYFVKAYWNIPLASRQRAWLRATAKESYTLMRSEVLDVSLCFLRFFSLLVTSFAFSRASRCWPEILRATHYSSNALISFSNFLKFSYGLLGFLAVRAVLYLVPYSSLALSCNLLLKPLPWLDCGLPVPPLAAVPTFPPLEATGL